MRGIIDRFEEEIAVVELENGDMINISKAKIPHSAKEGDVLNIGESISIDFEETMKRKIRIKKETDDIWS